MQKGPDKKKKKKKHTHTHTHTHTHAQTNYTFIQTITFQLQHIGVNANDKDITSSITKDNWSSLCFLTWHDGRARLILWQWEFPKPTAGTWGQKPDVISNLHDGASKNIKGSRHLNHGIMSCQCFKLIGSSDKWQSSQLWHLSGMWEKNKTKFNGKKNKKKTKFGLREQRIVNTYKSNRFIYSTNLITVPWQPLSQQIQF